MSTELVVPFGLSIGGQIAVTMDPVQQAQQHVDSLISTTPGERAMQPAYGVDLTGHIFGPVNGLSADVVSDIQAAFTAWEPSVQLQSVAPIQALTNDALVGAVQLDVRWAIPGTSAASSPSGISQATILVGGTVIVDQQVIT